MSSSFTLLCHGYEWAHCVSTGWIIPIGWIIYTCETRFFKQYQPKTITLHEDSWMNNEWIIFFSFFCKQVLDFSQPLLHKPIGTIDRALSLKRWFASANLFLFVLVGTSSSSPTRQQQLCESEEGPPGMLDHGCLERSQQHAFITETYWNNPKWNEACLYLYKRTLCKRRVVLRSIGISFQTAGTQPTTRKPPNTS